MVFVKSVYLLFSSCLGVYYSEYKQYKARDTEINDTGQLTGWCSLMLPASDWSIHPVPASDWPPADLMLTRLVLVRYAGSRAHWHPHLQPAHSSLHCGKERGTIIIEMLLVMLACWPRLPECTAERETLPGPHHTRRGEGQREFILK